MKVNRENPVTALLLAVALLVVGTSAHADVALPVGIKMPPDTRQAVTGQEYNGKFLVHVFKAGTIDDFQLTGKGWNVISFAPPDAPTEVQPGVMEIPFRAIPTDADKRIVLTFTYNGQTVRRGYELGPSVFERTTKPYRLRRMDDHELRELGAAVDPLAEDDVDEESSDKVTVRSQEIHVTGRIVYTRACRDMWDPNTGDPPDGDCDDPWDLPARVVGVDGIDVRLLDNDTSGSQEMWSGYTDVDGYFDTLEFTWEGSTFDPDPDLVIWAETEVDGLVDVTDDSIGEYTYWFDTPEVTDFTGHHYDFGTLTPSDSGLHPAMHLFNSIVRADRFIREVGSRNLPEVQVMWPDDSQVGGAWYDYNYDPAEIHVSTEKQWAEATHTHEYGHHFIRKSYSFDFPEADYCNDGTDFCDFDSGVPACYPSDIEKCSHCQWCRETDHDAFGEGFPNWLADVVTRDYPARYKFDDSTEFTALYGRSEEGIGVCCQDSLSHDPFITEGFVGALLRDIEDDAQDDHDGDGVMDTLCVGPGPIFDVVNDYEPVTISDFIVGFAVTYPSYADELYPTAYNVSQQYVSSFPTDIELPSGVAYVSSPSHPLLTGGGLPCITFQWLPADDDVRGACFYSFDLSSTSAGVEPDDTPDVVTTDGCYLQARRWRGLGQWWFSIKAQECPDPDGNPGPWGPTRTFGPFEVIDCNGSGYLDLCDIRCCAAECTAGPDFCSASYGSCLSGGCETSEDCNDNYVPDECDIADGTSDDCNLNGIPDECENMYNWDGGTSSWHTPDNWREDAVPTDGAEICIDVPGSETVVYMNGPLAVGTLACSESLSLTAGSPSPAELTLNQPSWIDGDLGLTGLYTVLEVNDRLDIGGVFRFTGVGDTRGAKLTGPGVTYANGGLEINNVAYLEDHTLILDSHNTSVCDGVLAFPGASRFEIRPGSTYEYRGDGGILSGWFDDNFVNEGTLIKSSDPARSTVYIFTENSGLIHARTGTLAFYCGGSSTGDFLADPGTTLEFNGGHQFHPGSSIVADKVQFPDGGHTIQGTYNVTTSTTNGAYVLNFTSGANIINYGSSFYIQRNTVNFDAIVDGPIHFDTLSIGPGLTGAGTANFNSGDPVQVENLILGPGTITSVGDVTIDGLLTWNASGSFSGPGTIHANGNVLVNPGGGEKSIRYCDFNNAGTATLLGSFNMPHGTVVFSNLATGVIDIQADGGAISGLGQTLNNAGTMVKTAGAGTSTISAPTTNTGTVEVRTGVLEFYTYYSGYYTQTAGQTILNGGDLAMFGPAPVRINGGLLTGEGTVTGNVQINSGATAAPGLSAGVLDIVGYYTQAVGGTLEIEIDGFGQGAEYDLLTVSGNASLAGSLEVIFPESGFTPLPGDSYEILTAGNVSGEFEPVNVTNLSPYLHMEVVYTTDAVTLNMEGVVFGDCDLDGEAALADHADLQTCLTGPDGGFGNECRCYDFDDDGHIDLKDFAIFQATFGAS